MWAIFAVVSAVFLGFYDVLKKISVQDNSVLIVLFLSTVFGALMFVPLLLISRFSPDILIESSLLVPQQSLKAHALFFLKSMIVGSSWIFAYFAIKHLPITIVSPIRATGPVWTLVGALIIFKEQLSIYQWIGVVITLVFFYMFSLAGLKEGISFKKNKWVLFSILGTLIGSASGLYDKYLIAEYNRIAVQAYFSLYMPIFLLPFLMYEIKIRKIKTSFQWRNTIPFIGILLVVADFAYFYALSLDDALISVISALRRTSVFIVFIFGAFLFKERNIKLKVLFLIGILTGVLIILFSS